MSRKIVFEVVEWYEVDEDDLIDNGEIEEGISDEDLLDVVSYNASGDMWKSTGHMEIHNMRIEQN